MRGLKGLGPLLLVGLVGLALMLFISEPGARWVSDLFHGSESRVDMIVAHVVQLEGRMKRLNGSDVETFTGPLPRSLSIYNGDRLEVNANSRALLILNSRDEFELGALSSVALQLWNEKDPGSPVYLNWRSGPLELKTAGVRDKAYVVHEGRLYLPGQKPEEAALTLTVSRSENADMQIADRG
ncbi:MAG: hypothetical protein AB7P49_10875, partial [Bdellovibrionales bacterium]